MMDVIVAPPLSEEENAYPWRPANKMCWCKKFVSVNSLHGGSYHRCGKTRREGHRTCWWHRQHEGKAARFVHN